jgi:hypothetical protein
MPTVTTSTAWNTLKLTLDDIVTDRNDEGALEWKQFCASETMDEHYVDDLAVGGPGFATEKFEAQAFDVGSIYEGGLMRYIARKFGLTLQVTDEIEDDGKYNSKYINAVKRLKRAVMKTQEVDAANMLNRAFNSLYTGGTDALSLANSAHTIESGGTFSNTLATPLAPSRAALITVIQNCKTLPGHDGIREGYKVTKVVHPIEQWGAWEGILRSEKVPESANNEVNVVQGMGIKNVTVTHWTASTTNWGVITDAMDGLKMKIRKAIYSHDWVDEPTEVRNYKVAGRWARGWSDPRGFYGSNA